ncbi:MAG: hypothetical protein WD342_09190 [Verrucomicrobiales bacterium]
MSFARRLRLDFGPAFFAILSLWGMSEFCLVYSDGDYPWSVDAAYTVGLAVAGFWWILSDAVRRRFPLMPVWGAWMTLAGSAVAIIYLFVSRGWWGFVTVLLYGLAFFLTSLLVRVLASPA